MAELKRLISSRRGFRAHLTKLLQSLTEILTNASQPPTDDNIASLKDLHEQLQRKQELISGLDAKILEATTNDEEIEAEVLQTEEVNSSISSAKVKITEHLRSESTTTKGHTSPDHVSGMQLQSTNTHFN